MNQFYQYIVVVGVLKIGTKGQCEASLSIINQVNKNFTQENEGESDSSVDSIVNGINENENIDEKDCEGRVGKVVPMSNVDRDVISKGKRQLVEREMVEGQLGVVNWSRSQLVATIIGRRSCWSKVRN